MTATERRAKMTDLIEASGHVRLGKLSKHFNVSTVTVHRDLDALAHEGLVKRVRGGAAAVGSSLRMPMTDWEQRVRDAVKEKAQIAKHARRYIIDGTTIFLDASTTALALARELQNARYHALTLVTNSPAIMHEIKAEHVHIIGCPGEVDQTLGMIGGPWTTRFLADLNIASSFVSAAGMSGDKVKSSRPDVADVLRTVVNRSERSYCLIHSSKFGRTALLDVNAGTEFEAIIVDDGLSARQVDVLRESGLNIELAVDEVSTVLSPKL
jgi:DeoR/GlpR family transcriptional regulator of sugar metabolism